MGGMLPLLLYSFVSSLVVSVGMSLLQNGFEAEYMPQQTILYAQTGIGMLGMFLAAVSVLGFYKKESIYAANAEPQKNKVDFRVKEVCLLVAAGAGIALLLNGLFSITGFIQNSETYQQVAEKQFSLPFWLAFLYYGLLSPWAEEMVFRGIFYRFLKRNTAVGVALIGSAIMFGAFHGNPVQMVYGTIMGILMAWIYEKYEILWAPMLFHGAANTAVYLMSYVGAF